MNIALLLSGGVDSSVALARLLEQGHTVTAFYLKIWLEDELSFLGDCPWEQDLAYARSVCEQLSVSLEVVPLQQEYHDRIVSYTVSEARAGRTPSPDVLCNQRIKFGAFLEYLQKRHPGQPVTPQAAGRPRQDPGIESRTVSGMTAFDKIASGHYAQIIDGTLRLAPDSIKDQTYFLAHLSQQQLNQLLFPIGDLTKAEVRAYAQKYNLPTKDRKDSQGICFLGKISFNQFLEHYLGTQQGDIVEEETGTVLGQHNGFWFHTVGQRKGLGLSGGPWYVVRKDIEQNVVYVSRNYYSDDKKRNTFSTDSVHWISGTPPTNTQLLLKIRHGAHRHTGDMMYHDDGSVTVKLHEDDQGLAPGQFAVFYDGDICLGCGVIR
jgi:tRNA-specific 2-thiouridylase